MSLLVKRIRNLLVSISRPVSFVYRVPNPLRPKGLRDQRWKRIQGEVEVISGQGGTNFRGKVESFSGQGGIIFTPWGKRIQGKVERKSGRWWIGGTVFMAQIWGPICGTDRHGIHI